MKILTLRIYNSTPYYDEMYNIHQTYDKNSIYLMASPNISNPIYDKNTNILTVPGYESLEPGILQKTLKGIQYCLRHFTFDVLIRSNMSTIIDYNELEKQLSSISTHIYGGHVWNYTIMKNFIIPERIKFISGCCTVMDKRVCELLITQPLRYNLPDDVAIGYALYKKVTITFYNLFTESLEKQLSSCFYRFRKDRTRYDNREIDIENMKQFYLRFNIT